MTPPQRNGSTITKLLLVEGNDDLRFFRALSRSIGTNDVAVDSYNGKSNLRNDLAERVRNPGFQTVTSLGIVRDADNNSQSAFDSVIGSLRIVNLPAPDTPTIPIERDGLRVSVLIVPPNDEQGELENVCLNSIEGTPDLECVEGYLACISNAGPPIAGNRLAKAKVHAYLSGGPLPKFLTGAPNESTGRRQPGLRLGESADRRVWDWASPAFTPLIGFLRNL